MRLTRALLVVAVVSLWIAAMPAASAGEGPAGYLGDDETCAACHDEAAASVQGNVHARIRAFEVLGHAVGCEGCHGPGAQHAEEGDPALIRRFAADDPESSEVCLSCHRLKSFPQWQASVHAAEGVGCLDCHAVHREVVAEDACRSCHADAVAQFQLPSHHPVREGKMTCASCHDVHGATLAMLKTHRRTNDLCYTCHQAVEGPFVFEHPPVQEDCTLCHAPHGAVANNLLVANEPMLCLQCHDYHFHAGYDAADGPVDVGGVERENPRGAQGFNIAFTTSCTQCHARIHGSDLPSQTSPGRGEALLR